MGSFRGKARLVVGSALLSCAAILTCVWPFETQADDVETAAAKQPDIGASTTELGPLLAKTRLVRDEGATNRWYLEVQVDNPGNEGVETTEYEAQLAKSTYEPMGRGGAMPVVAWKTTDTISVPAGESVTKRYPIPVGLSTQIANSLKPPKVNKNGIPRGSVTEFVTTINPKEESEG